MDRLAKNVTRELSPKDDLDRAELSGFQIVKRGAMKFIADLRGGILSDGYHEFKMFRAFTDEGELRIIIGTLGSGSCILNCALDKSKFLKVSDDFHEINYRADLKALTVRNGGLIAILSPFTGKAAHLSGYHSIERRGMEYFGTIGARTEKIEFIGPSPPAIIESLAIG